MGAKREQVVERRFFSSEEKSIIRAKSNNRCSHCGKLLTDDFTIEHVIPISKGGSNELTNLVGLCFDCNEEKGNDVYHPSDYYYYLKPDILQELVDNQHSYYTNVSWLSPSTLLPEDVRELKLEIIPKSIIARGVSRRGSKPLCAKTSVFLKKAVYSDLDKIYGFWYKYNRNTTVESVSDEEIRVSTKKQISEVFDNGVLYFLVDKVNEIKAVIPVAFSGYLDDYEASVDDANMEDGVVPFFETPIIQKSDVNYTLALLKSYTYILSNFAKTLNRPVYFIMQIQRLRVSCTNVFDAIMNLSDCAVGLDYFADKDSFMFMTIYNAKWSRVDDTFLDNAQSYDYVVELTERNKSTLTYLEKRSIAEHDEGRGDLFVVSNESDFNLDKHKVDMRVFAKNLARQLGYRSKDSRIELVPPSSDNSAVSCNDRYELLELPVSVLSFPDGVSANMSIPSFVKRQFKTNSVKHIKVDAFYVVSKEDAPFLAYLRQTNRKTVMCKLSKKDKEAFDSAFDIDLSGFSDAEESFIRRLYGIQTNGGTGSSVYARYGVVASQRCRCKICDALFSNDSMPYPALIVPSRRGGSYKEDNTIAVCSQCKGYIGRFGYSDELRSLILKELELDKSI